MANTVSENIRKLRIKKGISQDRLSKDADLVLNTVVKIETGESPNPTVDTLETCPPLAENSLPRRVAKQLLRGQSPRRAGGRII